jgi:UDP-N-acetylmuramoyl-L-alanyl-D-glutamate--2,6-diaminopimelate ligase
MILNQILKNLYIYQLIGRHDTYINKIEFDSRRVGQDDVFVAIKGLKSDGHLFINDAIKAGASCIVLDDKSFIKDQTYSEQEITKIIVSDSSQALAQLANAYYKFPGTSMKLIGITGTNGKTTTSYLVKSILEETGEKVGLIGTINYLIGPKVLPALKTTPESLEIFKILNEMRNESVNSVVMEVSSHSLALNRVFNLRYDIAAFTNLTQDHLDFHNNLDSYFRAKKILFDENLKETGTAVYNSDDPYGETIASDFKGLKIPYGLNNTNVTGKILKMDLDGLNLQTIYNNKTFEINSNLTGKFNAYNILAASAIGIALNVDPADIKGGIEKVANVEGRFQKIKSNKGLNIIVDYSHTPDSLYNALTAIKMITSKQKNSRIITVFGCGGNRDKTKRPEMGKIAVEYSDHIFITSDNPRDEEPLTIINDILKGIKNKSKVTIESDRRIAIESALSLAGENDTILIAGKGHERYQEIKGRRNHFDDREIVQSYLDRKK